MYYIKISKLLVDSKQNDYFSKNDLYVKINYIQDNKILSRKTQVVYNNNKPEWNEIFMLEKPNNLEILLYEKGKFMDKLLNSNKLKLNNNKIERIVYNQIEIYHGEVLFEDKEIKQKIIIENENLRNEIINKNKIIDEIKLNNDRYDREMINLNNLLKQLNLKNISLTEDNNNIKKKIENIKKIIN